MAKEEKSLTREDVLRLIVENGGTAKGLDLSRRTFERDIDLRELDLADIILKKAHLNSAHFEGASLMNAHLEGAELRVAHFEKAYLIGAHLEGADLEGAHLEGACLRFIRFSASTRLDDVDWGNYILREEEIMTRGSIDSYRRLKMWYTAAGFYDTAGEFFFREMTSRRKILGWWPNPLRRAWSTLLSSICGYGERPLRVIGWALSVILVSALIYFIIGSVWDWGAFWNSLYYSAASFTVGSGSLTPKPTGWLKGIGMFETFVGVFTMALFLVTFTRKMTR